MLNVGFLYIRNHGIPEEMTQNLVDALPVLFNMTEEEKYKATLHNSPHFLGYSGTGTERTAGKIDGREQFEFATELKNDWVEGQPLAEKLKGPSQVCCSEVFASVSIRKLTNELDSGLLLIQHSVLSSRHILLP